VPHGAANVRWWPEEIMLQLKSILVFGALSAAAVATISCAMNDGNWPVSSTR